MRYSGDCGVLLLLSSPSVFPSPLGTLFSLLVSLMFYTFGRPGWNGSKYNVSRSEAGEGSFLPCSQTLYMAQSCKPLSSLKARRKLKVQWQDFSSQCTQSNSLLSCSQGSSAHTNDLFTPCSTSTVLAELQYLLPDCSWVGRVQCQSLSCSVVCTAAHCNLHTEWPGRSGGCSPRLCPENYSVVQAASPESGWFISLEVIMNRKSAKCTWIYKVHINLQRNILREHPFIPSPSFPWVQELDFCFVYLLCKN